MRPANQLQSQGYIFRTETDTEAIAHLMAQQLDELINAAVIPLGNRNLSAGVQATLHRLKGTYGLAILFRHYPDMMMVARAGSPLVIGIGNGEHFVASDASPLVGYTDEVVYMADHEIAVVTQSGIDLHHRDSGRLSPSISTLDHQVGDIDKGDFEHYMLKGDLRAAQVD